MLQSSLAPTIVSELKIPGVTFQIADYHWDAGEAILDCESDVRIRWRIRPYQIKARGWVKPGEEVNFGQLMLHPADVPTYARAADESEKSRNLMCWFERDWLDQVMGDPINWDALDLVPCLDLRNGDMDHALRRIMREMLEPGFASATLAESIGISMAVDIVRYFELGGESAANEKGMLSPGRLRHIREYVESFTEGSPTLSDVARQCGISVAHLRRTFKLTTGQTMHDYIEEVRINRAKTLLLDTNLPLKLVSYRLGFCHPSAFSFAFKKNTGESPREFRHRCATGLSVDN